MRVRISAFVRRRGLGAGVSKEAVPAEEEEGSLTIDLGLAGVLWASCLMVTLAGADLLITGFVTLSASLTSLALVFAGATLVALAELFETDLRATVAWGVDDLATIFLVVTLVSPWALPMSGRD